uniref:Phosphotransferase n=1 Tax=Wuchereria bancrofti TaxID=6293 RepID=A0AAF5RX73_WUCBA
MLGLLTITSVFRNWRNSLQRKEEYDECHMRGINNKNEISGKNEKNFQLDEPPISLETVMSEFQLTNETLRRMMAHMSRNMDKGLEGGPENSTISMLPSFVPELPDGTEEGRFIAMDLGGTNLRVMLMDIIPGEELKTEQFNTRIPNWAMRGTGEQLFDYITKCLAEFLIEKGIQNDGLPVGFTFSYPCDQKSLCSATLLRWTKGFETTGVVGEDVVELLEQSIARRGDIKVEVVALINDTVGTMVAAAHENGGECHIGVIIATGTNASYMEDASKTKYGLSKATTNYNYPEMIVDTEWGGFGDRSEADYILTQYDKIVDSRSEHPGVNTFDKLVGGKCMGEVVRVVLEKLTRAGVLFSGKGSDALFQRDSFPTKYISEILSDESGSYVNTRDILDELGIDNCSFSDMLILREVCVVVSRRSANLGAAAIACVLNRVRKRNMVVGIDGSTYKYHPFFDFWVHDKLKELVDPGLKFKLLQTADGSGKGAALITAIVARLKKRNLKQQQQEQCKIDEHITVVEDNVAKQITKTKGNREQFMNENEKIDLVTDDIPTYDSFNGEIENNMIVHLSTDH